MPNKPKNSRKSERKKMAVAGVLAVVLLYLLVSQFGANNADSTASSETVAPTANRSGVALNGASFDSNRNVTPSTSSATSKTPSQTPGTLGASLPASMTYELSRASHDDIAAHNPFFDVVHIPDAQLVLEPDNPAVPEEKADQPQVIPPKVNAVYVTPEGAIALIDGELVPIQNPAPAIDAIKSNWGNDYSDSIESTEN